MNTISKRNRFAAFLAFLSGCFFIASGTNGISSWKKIESVTLTVLNSPIVQGLFFIILIFAALGGLTIIFGGFLIKRNKVRLGKTFILIGSGTGLISLVVNLITVVNTSGLSFNMLFTLAPIGVFLSILAQIFAKSEKRY